MEALILVNNRLEGNAPGTIRALVEMMEVGGDVDVLARFPDLGRLFHVRLSARHKEHSSYEPYSGASTLRFPCCVTRSGGKPPGCHCGAQPLRSPSVRRPAELLERLGSPQRHASKFERWLAGERRHPPPNVGQLVRR